jgi:hypothetical protein
VLFHDIDGQRPSPRGPDGLVYRIVRGYP